MLVRPKWVDSILQHGCSGCQRALWATFKTGEDIIGICNIYARNDYKERIALWDWCSSYLLKASCTFVGDFNMIEVGCDKQGGLKYQWKGNEHLFWCKLRRCFNLFDPLENNRETFNDIWFTWCNNQGGHNRVYCKLAKFIVILLFFIPI